ncbi:MAG: hypothetical protein VB141_13770, partial [Burkholderia gladioli]
SDIDRASGSASLFDTRHRCVPSMLAKRRIPIIPDCIFIEFHINIWPIIRPSDFLLTEAVK